MENFQFQEAKKNIVAQLSNKKVSNYQLQQAIDSETWDELQEFITEYIGYLNYLGIVIPDGYYNGKYRQFTIKNGKFHGDFFSYHENGELEYFCHYVNGLKHGKELEFYHNSQMFREGHYVNDQKHGKFLRFDFYGNLETECTFVFDEVHGDVIHYYSDGEIFEKKTFNNGELVEPVC
jgi:hypothetical protein